MAQNVSLIIPTLNEQTMLPRLLNSIGAQKYEARIQVIVVDGGSSDKTVEQARQLKSKLDDLEIIETQRGLSRQRNMGASRAKYPHIIFVDADSTLPPSFLKRLYSNKKASSNKPYVSIPLLLPDKLNFLDYVFAASGYLFFLRHKFSNPIVTGMCLITTKSNHDIVGGFDEKAIYGEDIQYGIESFQKGAKYHIFMRAHLFTSARRGRELGRVKVGRTWLAWYRSVIKDGTVPDKADYDYKFGHFK